LKWKKEVKYNLEMVLPIKGHGKVIINGAMAFKLG
jgi:hypothetical protein